MPTASPPRHGAVTEAHALALVFNRPSPPPGRTAPLLPVVPAAKAKEEKGLASDGGSKGLMGQIYHYLPLELGWVKITQLLDLGPKYEAHARRRSKRVAAGGIAADSRPVVHLCSPPELKRQAAFSSPSRNQGCEPPHTRQHLIQSSHPTQNRTSSDGF